MFFSHPRFSVYRLFKLIAIDVRLTYSYLLLSLMVPLLLGLLSGYRNDGAVSLSLMHAMMALYIWLGGMQLASQAFKETHFKLTHFTWVMTPATNLEIFLSRSLMTSVIFLAFSILSFIGIYLLISLAFGHEIKLVEFITSANFHLEFWVHYFFWHSVFMLGSAVFKKSALIKTSVVILIVMLMILTLLGQMVDEHLLKILVEYFVEIQFDDNRLQIDPIKNQMLENYHWILAGVTSILWGLSYLKISRAQAKYTI